MAPHLGHGRHQTHPTQRPVDLDGCGQVGVGLSVLGVPACSEGVATTTQRLTDSVGIDTVAFWTRDRPGESSSELGESAGIALYRRKPRRGFGVDGGFQQTRHLQGAPQPGEVVYCVALEASKLVPQVFRFGVEMCFLSDGRVVLVACLISAGLEPAAIVATEGQAVQYLLVFESDGVLEGGEAALCSTVLSPQLGVSVPRLLELGGRRVPLVCGREPSSMISD